MRRDFAVDDAFGEGAGEKRKAFLKNKSESERAARAERTPIDVDAAPRVSTSRVEEPAPVNDDPWAQFDNPEPAAKPWVNTKKRNVGFDQV